MRHQTAPSLAPPQAQCRDWLNAAGLKRTRQKYGCSSLQKSREPSQNLSVSQFFPTCLSHLLTWGFYLVSTSLKFWNFCLIHLLSGHHMNKICCLMFLFVNRFTDVIINGCWGTSWCKLSFIGTYRSLLQTRCSQCCSQRCNALPKKYVKCFQA